MNESQEVAQVIDDLWELYNEFDVLQTRMGRQRRLLWPRLHRLESAMGMKE